MKKQPKVGIAAVAARAQVSIATVSQILNGKGARFAAATRARVLQARDELGYVPDYRARTLVGVSTRTLGVVVPDLTNPFFSELVAEISTAAQMRHFLALPLTGQSSRAAEKAALTEFFQRAVDGVIVAGSVLSLAELKELFNKHHTPYLLLDQAQSPAADSVVIDEAAGGKMAAAHLVAQHHHTVALVQAENSAPNLTKRYAGFKQAMTEAGGRVISLTTPMTKLGGYLVTKEVLDSHATAAFTVNDDVAVGLLRGLNELGISVPEQFSVLGYDNTQLGQYVTPALTTIEQPRRKLAQVAVATLIERVNHPHIAVQHHTLPVLLVVRQSTRTLKK